MIARVEQVDEFGLPIRPNRTGMTSDETITSVEPAAEPRLDLTQAVRDTLGRAMLSVSYHNLKASGEIPASAKVKPAPAADVALIAAAYEYLQSSGQLPPPASDVVVCVHSSDELTDFFVSNDVGDCQEIVCKFIGIESVEDLKLITAVDLQGSRFSTWANGSLTMVQYKKLLKAFS